MLVLGITDSLRGSASVADKIDFSCHGAEGTTPALLAQGQLAVADAELFAATAITIVKSIVMVNTHTAAITINLTLLKSGSVARRLIPKDLSLGIGYLLVFDGSRFAVFDDRGNLQTGAGGIVNDTIWAAAGDLVQGTGNDAGEVLSIGAANLKAFVNAAGSKIEWAGGIKVGTFERDTATAAGTQAISGVGFKPSHVLFMAVIPTTRELSFGFDDGTNAYSIYNYGDVTDNQWLSSTTYSTFLRQAGSKDYAERITTLGADGFTITWTKAGDKTGTATIHYMAFR